MDDYEIVLLNMSYEEMDRIANGDDKDDENTDLRPGEKPDPSLGV